MQIQKRIGSMSRKFDTKMKRMEAAGAHLIDVERRIIPILSNLTESEYIPQTDECTARGVPAGRCVPADIPYIPKIKLLPNLCTGPEYACAVYEYNCTQTPECKAKAESDDYYFAGCFAGYPNSFYYLPSHQEFPDLCEDYPEPDCRLHGCIGPYCGCPCQCIAFKIPTN